MSSSHGWGLGVVVVVVVVHDGMVTALSTQVVGSSSLLSGRDDAGSRMVAAWSMQAVAVVVVGAVAGSHYCRVGIGCHCCRLVDSTGGGQCCRHHPSSMVGPSSSLLIMVVVVLTVLVVVMAVGEVCSEVLENIDS